MLIIPNSGWEVLSEGKWRRRRPLDHQIVVSRIKGNSIFSFWSSSKIFSKEKRLVSKAVWRERML